MLAEAFVKVSQYLNRIGTALSDVINDQRYLRAREQRHRDSM